MNTTWIGRYFVAIKSIEEIEVFERYMRLKLPDIQYVYEAKNNMIYAYPYFGSWYNDYDKNKFEWEKVRSAIYRFRTRGVA